MPCTPRMHRKEMMVVRKEEGGGPGAAPHPCPLPPRSLGRRRGADGLGPSSGSGLTGGGEPPSTPQGDREPGFGGLRGGRGRQSAA